jgi:hypothetical protein
MVDPYIPTWVLAVASGMAYTRGMTTSAPAAATAKSGSPIRRNVVFLIQSTVSDMSNPTATLIPMRPIG